MGAITSTMFAAMVAILATVTLMAHEVTFEAL